MESDNAHKTLLRISKEKDFDADYTLAQYYAQEALKINDNNIYSENNLKNFTNLDYKVNNNKNIYVQDSVLLGNYNSNIGGHSIAGITCKGDKYVYNGWTRTTIDPNIKQNSEVKDWKEMLVNNEYWYFHIPSGQIVKETNSSYPNNFPTKEFFGKKNIEIPCELMKFSWDVKKNKEFCLNPQKCILDIMNVNDLCFSFNKIVIFVQFRFS